MKNGVQITTTQDGAWSVRQLVQNTPNGEFTSTGDIIFVDHSKAGAEHSLLDAIRKGLAGQITGTSSI